MTGVKAAVRLKLCFASRRGAPRRVSLMQRHAPCECHTSKRLPYRVVADPPRPRSSLRAAFCSLRAHVRVAHHLHRPPLTTRAASPRAATPRARYPKNQSVESNKTRNLAQAPTRGQVAATTAPISEYEPYMHSTNPRVGERARARTEEKPEEVGEVARHRST